MLLQSAIGALLLAFAAFAQTSPESQSLRDARKIKEPDERLQALRAVIARYPKHNIAIDARYSILETSLQTPAKEDRKHILKLVNEFIKSQRKPNRRSAWNSVASLLLEGNVHLVDAEQFARKSLAAYDAKKFAENWRKDAIKAKRPESDPAEIDLFFHDSRNGPAENVGLILLAQGKTAEGRAILEEILARDPMRGRSAAALAMLAEKEGDTSKALDLLYQSRLTGRMPKARQADLERLHKNGSIEEALDRTYREKFPPPIHAEPYRPTTRTGRVVLAEVFTGSGCPPCAAVDLAFDVILERYAREDVAVLMYHQHIPRPDPMTNPGAEARFKWYARGGVPTYVIDGKVDGGGGPRGSAPFAYKKINNAIEKRLPVPPKADIQLEVTSRDGVVHAKAATKGAGKAKLHLVLAEKELRYTGENGIRFHPMVVRDQKEFDLDLSAPSHNEHAFNIAAISQALDKYLDDYQKNGRHGKFEFTEKKHQIDPKDLVVVAFLQDPETKEILQSVYR